MDTRGPFYEFGAFKRPEKFVDCEEGREAGAVHFPPPPGPAKRGSRLRPQQTRPGEPCPGPCPRPTRSGATTDICRTPISPAPCSLCHVAGYEARLSEAAEESRGSFPFCFQSLFLGRMTFLFPFLWFPSPTPPNSPPQLTAPPPIATAFLFYVCRF